MVDPLSEIITLLRPRAVFTKGISGAGRWGVRYSEFGHPSFCAVLEGSCRLAVDGQDAAHARGGRFRAAADNARLHPVGLRAGHARHSSTRRQRPRRSERFAMARPTGRRAFACSAATSSSIPTMRDCWCRCCRRRCMCAASSGFRSWCGSSTEEASEQRAGRDLVLARLVEVLLIEALRSTQRPDAPPGLLRGLGDARLADAIRQMHGDPARPWTVAAACERGRRFRARPSSTGSRAMSGCRRWNTCSPGAWRSPRTCCAATTSAIAEVAERVGYGSASTFSTAFSRHVGQPPGRYARAEG